MTTALNYTVTAKANESVMNINSFDGFVGRSVELSTQQAAQVQTAVRINADGSTSHVPTKVYSVDGKYYAEFYSLTNSAYALIGGKINFPDVKTQWFSGVVDEMASRRVISGKDSGNFDGESDITRAEFATLIVKAMGLIPKGDSLFTDVKQNDWFASNVATATKYGIVSGRGNGIYDPHAKISRQEAMMMIYNAAKYTSIIDSSVKSSESFNDIDTTSAWAKTAVEFCINKIGRAHV